MRILDRLSGSAPRYRAWVAARRGAVLRSAVATVRQKIMSTDFDWFSRLAIAIAGILGAAGVAAAAAASHKGDTRILGSLALIALTQAPAVLALGLYAGGRTLRVATAVIGLGALVFSADLALRHFTGGRLFPMSAPLGGTAMIVGWLILIVAAVVTRQRPSSRS
jgi:uncharacterized membrane protein YgdD (TMEM256/DUF423 family)